MEGVSVCSSIISTTVHPIDFTLGGCTAEDPRKCSVEREVFLDERFSRKLHAAIPEAKRSARSNGHCSSYVNLDRLVNNENNIFSALMSTNK